MTIDTVPPQLAALAHVGPYFRNRAVLVTGGLGFVGSNLVRCLIQLGARVAVLDNLHPRYGGNRFNLEGMLDKLEALYRRHLPV